MEYLDEIRKKRLRSFILQMSSCALPQEPSSQVGLPGKHTPFYPRWSATIRSTARPPATSFSACSFTPGLFRAADLCLRRRIWTMRAKVRSLPGSRLSVGRMGPQWVAPGSLMCSFHCSPLLRPPPHHKPADWQNYYQSHKRLMIVPTKKKIQRSSKNANIFLCHWCAVRDLGVVLPW